MTKKLFILLVLVFSNSSWAQCPEDTVDLGICDTLYIQCYDCDLVEGPPPWNVHILLSVTHDVTTSIDSIQGFVIPFSYSSAYGGCSFLPDSNTNDLSGPGLSTSIFRHFGGMENRMLDLEQLGGGESWDTRIIDIDNPTGNFFISLSASGTQDQKWGDGSHILLATLTMTVNDTAMITIDTTFWEEFSSLSYIRGDGKPYLPRIYWGRYYFAPSCYYVGIKPGDANCDGHVSLGDIVYLGNYLYRGGPPPRYLWAGDVNCDGVIDQGDSVYLINYICKGGPPPCPSC
ncbi:MAG: dockerin type I repeat-containing protein [candidate division Zixibacteria bacterium]|nr:dockerin type I repeat-containing protein [candidate division Zixibacteria bacterium]